MLSKKQRLLYNSYSDLYRAAKAFFLNPEGKVWIAFVQHCKGELGKIQTKKVYDFLSQLRKIEKESKTSSGRLTTRQKQNLADRLLTLGILLKDLR